MSMEYEKQNQQQDYGVQQSQPLSYGAQNGSLGSILSSNSSVFVKQQIGAVEAVTGGLYEQKNKYTVYGQNGIGTEEIFTAEEESSFCSRCFCAPQHSLFIRISVNGNVEYTLERKGLCCEKICLLCPACTESCADEMSLYQGAVDGKPGNVMNATPLYTVRQVTACGAMFHPTLHVFRHGSSDPSVEIKGPCIFGGCSELCCSSSFKATKRGQDAGMIKKMRPNDCCTMLSECATDADRFQLDFDSGADGDERIAMLAALFLTDFMFFEQDLGTCKPRPNGTFGCTCFECYCCGILCPCTFTSNSS